jgi:hypothetical protein
MDVWTATSSPAKQLGLAIVSLAVGAALMAGFRHYGQVGSDQFAGFLLGVLLAGIGGAGAIACARQTVIVDPRARRITVQDAHLWGASTRGIAFDDVAAVGVGSLGKRSNHGMQYYLVLKLRNGRDFSLFAPGRLFRGSSERSTVEGWRRRLEGYLTT